MSVDAIQRVRHVEDVRFGVARRVLQRHLRDGCRVVQRLAVERDGVVSHNRGFINVAADCRAGPRIPPRPARPPGAAGAGAWGVVIAGAGAACCARPGTWAVGAAVAACGVVCVGVTACAIKTNRSGAITFILLKATGLLS